jgi:hypothetical protein
LNAHGVWSLARVRALLERFRTESDTEHRHSSLDYTTPEETAPLVYFSRRGRFGEVDIQITTRRRPAMARLMTRMKMPNKRDVEALGSGE